MTNLEIPFMQDLRNFTLHRTLPFLSHSLTIHAPEIRPDTITSKMSLSVAQLLEWDGWRSAPRKYLTSTGEAIGLQPLILRHGQLIHTFNEWMCTELRRRISLDGVNDLLTRLNALLHNVDYEAAKRLSVPPWLRSDESESDETV